MVWATQLQKIDESHCQIISSVTFLFFSWRSLNNAKKGHVRRIARKNWSFHNRSPAQTGHKDLLVVVFPKIGGKNWKNHQNGWFRMENPIKMDDLGVLTIIFGNIHFYTFPVVKIQNSRKKQSQTPSFFGFWGLVKLDVSNFSLP